MTDEQAVRKLLAEEFRYGPNTHVGQLAAQALALLDAKDAELREYKEAHAFIGSDRDAALSRAEQAEAALAEERKAHQAFREDLNEAISELLANKSDATYAWSNGVLREHLFHFILPAKPADKLAEIVTDLWDFDHRAADELRAAIERAGGTIDFGGDR